jgi:nucleoside-diphosphate-sugar epimerase
MLMLKVSGANGFVGQAILKYCANNRIPAIGYCRSKALVPELVQLKDYMQIPAGGRLIHLAESRQISEVDENVMQQQGALAAYLATQNFDKIVYASSAAVYATSEQIIDIDAAAYADTLYAQGKLNCERLFVQSGHLAARLANIYGPGMAPQNVMSAILAQRQQAQISVFTLNSVRDYIWVDDVAAGLVQMALSQQQGVFHLSSGIATSVLDLIQHSCQLANNSQYQIIQTKQIPQSTVVLNPAKTQQFFGWHPAVDLKQGLSLLIQEQACSAK